MRSAVWRGTDGVMHDDDSVAADQGSGVAPFGGRGPR